MHDAVIERFADHAFDGGVSQPRGVPFMSP